MAKYLVNEETREIYFTMPIQAKEVNRILNSLGERHTDYYIGLIQVPKAPVQPQQTIIPMGPPGEA